MPSRFQDSEASAASRIVAVGQPVFNARLEKLLSAEDSVEVVATATSIKQAMAYPNEFGADLIIVDTDFGGEAEGVALSRYIAERSPACAVMLVCGAFTSTLAKNLWVYSTDAWSIVSQATAKNGPSLTEAITSAVHGMTWVEPGIAREMREYGPRPRSLDERKLAMFERRSSAA